MYLRREGFSTQFILNAPGKKGAVFATIKERPFASAKYQCT
jgi:hypothetical protein